MILRPPQATCRIRVFKAGLLSAMGHDLELDLPSFQVEIEGDRVEGRFDGRSLTVRGALQGGRLDERALSEKDKREILDNLRKTVFKAHRPGEIRFEGQLDEDDGEQLEGQGTLHIPPRQAPLAFRATRTGERVEAILRLDQTRWGIEPFKAPLGVLKIQPELEVWLGLPLPRAR